MFTTDGNFCWRGHVCVFVFFVCKHKGRQPEEEEEEGCFYRGLCFVVFRFVFRCVPFVFRTTLICVLCFEDTKLRTVGTIISGAGG